MARNVFEFAQAPHLEECTPVGAEGYREKATKECQALANQIKRQFGEPPPGVRLKVQSNPHDLGSYLELVAVYDDADETQGRWVFKVEAELAGKWDKEAREELGLPPE